MPRPRRLPTPPPVIPREASTGAGAPPAISVEQMMIIAKRDLGKIDKDLRKESRQVFSAAGDTRQQRLARDRTGA